MSKPNSCGTLNPRFSSAFTLIELLVVIAILAVLAVVVVLTLNPAGLLQESRDANRLQDMGTLTSAISYSLADNAGESLGVANTIYVSIADPTATSTVGDQCQGLGLPILPALYSYHCAATSTYRKTDGTGWVPVSLANNTFGSSVSQLPIDPINASSSRLWYSYATDANGKFEVTTPFESAKYKLGGSNDQISGDGGTLASVYEKGSKLGLEPLDYGDASLLGLWTFDEGSGSVVYDYSGSNATGSWNGALGNQWTAGKVGSFAGNFLGTASNSVVTAFQYSLSATSNFTWAAWVYSMNVGGNTTIIGNRVGSLWAKITPVAFEYGNGSIISFIMPTSSWRFIVVTKTGSAFNYYNNASLVGTGTSAATVTNLPFDIGGDPNFTGDGFITGMIDDVRVYNRALGIAEITAMYNGGK